MRTPISRTREDTENTGRDAHEASVFIAERRVGHGAGFGTDRATELPDALVYVLDDAHHLPPHLLVPQPHAPSDRVSSAGRVETTATSRSGARTGMGLSKAP
jgi:hypothetical protein